MANEVADFIDNNSGGGGAPSFKFANVGDTLKGTIKRLAVVTTTDNNTKESVKNLVINVETDDEEEFTLWIKPSQLLQALSEALNKAGIKSTEMAPGDRIAVEFYDTKPTKLSPQKLYRVKYKAAPRAANINLDDL